MHCDITLQFFNCVCLFLQQGEKTLTIKFVPQIPSTSEMGCRLNGSSAALTAVNVSGVLSVPFQVQQEEEGHPWRPSRVTYLIPQGAGSTAISHPVFTVHSLKPWTRLSVYLLRSAILG